MSEDKFKDIKEKHRAIHKLRTKRLRHVSVEQGGGRLPLVPYGEMGVFNRQDFNWLAWESHHVINLAMKGLEQEEDYEEYMKYLEEELEHYEEYNKSLEEKKEK